MIGRTYLVRVKAVALHTGSSGYIDTPVKAAGSPTTPALLAATIDRDGRTVNVVWTAVASGTPSDITSYTVSWFQFAQLREQLAERFAAVDTQRSTRGSRICRTNAAETFGRSLWQSP